MMILRQVGINLRRARIAKGLSQEALANDAEVAMNYVSGIERGTRNPTVLILARLCRILGMPPAQLFAPVSGKEGLSKNLKPGRRQPRSRGRAR